MRHLAVISRLTGVSTNVEASEVTLNAPSIVKLSAERSDISQLARVNQDLVITFTSGEKLTVKNFYVANDQGASQLVLEDSHGALWWVENPENGLHFEQISTIDDLLITAGESHEGGALWPWLLGARLLPVESWPSHPREVAAVIIMITTMVILMMVPGTAARRGCGRK